MPAAEKATVKVREGYAVHDGERHRVGGETFDVSQKQAAEWAVAGYVELVRDEQPAKRAAAKKAK